MKKLFSILICFVLILSLTACGASSYDSEAPMENMAMGYESAPMEAPMPMPESEVTSDSISNVKVDTRKLVKHSDMDMQTKDFDKALEDIFSSIDELGGYVEYQQISGQNLYNHGRSERHAEINARIPVENLSKAEEKFSQLFNVTNQSSHIEDITDRYFDTDARLNSAKAKEARLLELLEKAETMEDIIAIESKLSDVRYEIESLTASIQRMDKQVAYSYLNLNLYEVIDYDVAEKTFSEKLLNSFKISAKNIGRWAENSLFFVIEDLPVVLLRLAVLAFVIWIVGLVVRRFDLWEKLKHLFKRKDKK